MDEPLPPGTCYMPFQPPHCTETIGDSLGWIFVVFQVCWALVWSLGFFFILIGTIARGWHKSMSILIYASLMALIELIRSYNPAGVKEDQPATSRFLQLFIGVASGWAIFELAFLLMSILGMQQSQLGPLATPFEKLTHSLPLSPEQNRVRAFLHLCLWGVLFAAIDTKTLGRAALMTLLWSSFTAVFAVFAAIQLILARRRLLKAQLVTSNRSRAISQSKRLFQLFLSCAVLICIWLPLLFSSVIPTLSGPHRNDTRATIDAPCNFGCVILLSVHDIIVLVIVVLAFLFFVLPEKHKASRQTATAETGTKMMVGAKPTVTSGTPEEPDSQNSMA